MPLGDEHLMPRVNNMFVDEENNREELERLLDVIPADKRSRSADISRNAIRSRHTMVGNNNFAGRYVTKVVSVFPLEVSKRFVWPHLTPDGIYRPSGRLILRKLFDIDHMDNTLLVITPTAMATRCANKYIVHCYTVDTQWHLGTSNLVNNETALLKQALGPDGLSIIFCSSYINLEDAYMSTPIKAQLFQMHKMKCKAPVLTWYRGRCISLHMWSSESQDTDIVVEPDMDCSCHTRNGQKWRNPQRVEGGNELPPRRPVEQRLPTGRGTGGREVKKSSNEKKTVPPQKPKVLSNRNSQLAENVLRSGHRRIAKITEQSLMKNPRIPKEKNNTVKNSHWRLPVPTSATLSLASVGKSRR